MRSVCCRARSPRGTIAELAPALLIGCLVIFFIIGFGFYICGVATAYYACTLASREGASGGSRAQIRTAAITAANRVANSSLGAFVNLKAQGGGAFGDALDVRFQRVNDDGSATPFAGGAVERGRAYQIVVDSNYQISIPFLGTIPGQASNNNVVDNPESSLSR
ncbi:MAG: hypothetical protein K2W95_26025 [Candidatus Obscuribacterales bacterium]|nr:hypothetical protein [Candidatus Obscuribacterales bacterium]